MKMKVFRFERETGYSRYDTFEIEPPPGMTVLSALFRIQEDLDDSLAFRYACRGAVCGNCAMLINKVPRLACRTRIEPLLKGEGKIKMSPFPGTKETVSWDPENEILVEPLPSLPKIKDLIVDMDKFFELTELSSRSLNRLPDLLRRSILWRLKP
jgi:succinate dehydrogenase / fumarate reductase iron-sulfur subunit